MKKTYPPAMVEKAERQLECIAALLYHSYAWLYKEKIPVIDENTINCPEDNRSNPRDDPILARKFFFSQIQNR